MWIKIHGGPYQQAGIPDILGCLGGQFFGFEVKVPERAGNVTKLQRKMIDTINTNRGIACVVTSYEQAEQIVEEFLDYKESIQ